MEKTLTKKDDKEETLRERPELPDDVEGGDDIEEFNSIDIIGPGRGTPRREYPSRTEQQTDPMLPLIYFSTGVISTLLAFLVFYLCLRHFPKHKNCEPKAKLADKED